MKKNVFYACILLVAVMLGYGLTSCSDNDDKEVGKIPERTGKMTFEFSFNGDVLELADVELTFVDVDGSLKTEVVKQFPWKKTVLFSLVPVTTGYSVKVTPKKDLELKDDSYEISKQCNNMFYEIQGEGVVSMESLKSESTTFTLDKSNVVTILEGLSEDFVYSVDADFNCSKKK